MHCIVGHLYLNKGALTKISKRRQGKNLLRNREEGLKSLWQEKGCRVGGVCMRIAAFYEEP